MLSMKSLISSNERTAMDAGPIDLLVALNKAGLSCTSCCACEDACEFDALHMAPDELGFPRPSIDRDRCLNCGQCLRACAPLQFASKNTERPDCFAFIGPYDDRMKSSSGGAFAVLGRRMIDGGGKVVGAALDDDCRGCSLRVASTLNELDKLRGSKYVQSMAGNIYRDVKEMLDNGEKVFFTGVPCQVAALYTYLGKEYENLFSADIFCHSSPSPEMYRRYIDELAETRGKAIHVDFRPKEYSWEALGVKVVFADGSANMTVNYSDPYLLGFHKSLYCKDSCMDCPFQETPRTGDITIGDFWGIEVLYPDVDASKGASVVLVNNKKGEEMLDWLSPAALTLSAPYSFIKEHNRMGRKRYPHLAKQRFMNELLPSMSFSKAVDMALNWKFDVAITGSWCVPNYGGSVSYYALYETIRELGYHPIMVETCAMPYAATPSSIAFRETPYPFYNVSRIHNDIDEMGELNDRVANFVVGSDQVWNPSINGFEMSAAGAAYSLAFVKPWRKRISYASSFGSVHYKGTPSDKSAFSQELRKFDYVSVREEGGVRICKDEFGVESSRRLDPVFLCDRSSFDILGNKSRLSLEGQPITFYLVWPDRLGATRKVIKRISSEIGARYIAIGDAIDAKNRSRKSKYPYETDFCSEDWIHCIRNSRFIVTDSFHAVCFAIIYRIDFVFIVGKYSSLDNGLDRITSLLSALGLLDRVLSSLKSISSSQIWKKKIDYEAVYSILNPLIDSSREWLVNAIEEPKEFA